MIRISVDRARFRSPRGGFSAAAPISIHTLEFFLSIGIPILEIYGMSENTGPTTLSTRDRYRTGKAGWPMDGTELKIEADGEICMRGPHFSPGYFKDPAAACPVLRSHLETQVEEVNAGLARFETIKRFNILPTELSVAGGEMTPTMKLKRRIVNERYSREIAELYP